MPLLSEKYNNAETPNIARTISTAIQSLRNLTQRWESLPELNCSGCEGYKILSELDNVVLCVKDVKSFGYYFTTWERDYEGGGVHTGNCWQNDYEGAKGDFALRSGMVEKSVLFSETELKVIYAGLLKMNELDEFINSGDCKMNEFVMNKIENILPSVGEIRQTEIESAL